MYISDRRLKKYLQKQAEKDAELLITDADREFCKNLAEYIVAKNKLKEDEKQRRKNFKRRKKELLLTDEEREHYQNIIEIFKNKHLIRPKEE